VPNYLKRTSNCTGIWTAFSFPAKFLPLALIIPLTLFLGVPHEASAGCVTTAGTPTIIDCTGDQSSGVSKTVSSETTLNVDNLTTTINTSDIGVELYGKGSNGGTGSKGNRGGGGSNGPTVILNHEGTVATSNVGIKVTSIGGDGGNGGGNWGFVATGGDGGDGADGSTATANVDSGSVTTTGDDDYGIWVLSQGGDGGNGGTSTAAEAYGGDGGLGGDGGIVYVNNSVSVLTSGDNAHGILAQSISGSGGGGGDGLAIVSGGGAGDGSGNAGNVNVTNSGDITTTGAIAYGILAFSFGGDAGDGGAGGGIVGFGGESSDGGDAGNIIITNNVGGDITTATDYSHAIFGQSTGGGGGSGGSGGGIVGLGGGGSEGGSTGTVIISNDAILETNGSDADGIFAQSVGGGGGDGGGSGGGV
jgi:hypothetical protein